MKKIFSFLVVAYLVFATFGSVPSTVSAWSGTWSFEESCTEEGLIDVEATYTPSDEHGGTVGYDSPNTDLEVGDVVEVSLVEDHGQASSYTVTNTEDCAPEEEDMCPNIDGVQTEVPEGKHVDDYGNCVPDEEDVCENIDGVQTEVPNGMHSDGYGNCLENDKINICHATSSHENPYNFQTPNKSADVSGHDGHNGPIWFSGIEETWGDIIPPFTFPGGSYAGQNWTTAGIAIYENDCDMPEDLNNAPMADAGPDQIITLPTNSVTLDGSASTDTDGTITSYEWSFVSGPSNVDPTDTEISSASGLVAGTYVFELKVTDNEGATDTDTVSITVNEASVNPECSDDVDNNDPEDALADELDPGCHTDSDPTNPDSYNPNDNDETDLPECSDGKDNADPEDTLIDANDPGCHTDGDAENTASYDPNDNDETDTNGGGGDDKECSDGVDNDDPEDTLADELDPGCHTDGNPDNTESYDPNDDDETNEDGTGGSEDPQCSDSIDNDDDDKIDEEDPGCHTDGDPDDGDDTYRPEDDDETDEDDNGGGGGSSGGSRRSSGSRPQGQVLGAETCGIYVERFLRVGYQNDVDTVIKVQNFLNDYMNSGLVVNGIYGVETAAAVSAFQLQHADTVLAPWGITAPTGIFYLTTQTAVNNIICPDLNLPIPSPLINWSVAIGAIN